LNHEATKKCGEWNRDYADFADENEKIKKAVGTLIRGTGAPPVF
jgi:hypothetical protein